MMSRGEIKTFLQLGDFGEDVSVLVQYRYKPLEKSHDYYQEDNPEIIVITEISVTSWGVGILLPVSEITEDAYDRICNQISEQENRKK